MRRRWLKLGVSIITLGQFRGKFSYDNFLLLLLFCLMLYFSMDSYSAVIIVVVQAEERNMYDQHFVSAILRERYPFLNSSNYSIRRKHYFFLLYSKANSLICIIRTIECDIQGFRVIILNFMTRIILQPYGKRWQKLIKKEKFCRMEHFLCM
jgi:hypothetical protein